MKDSWVVTGAGLITVAGDTPAALMASLRAGRSLAGPHAATGLPVAEIASFDPKAYVARRGVGDLSRTSQLACAAAGRLAPFLQGLDPAEVGVVLGSAWGSLRTIVDFEREAHVEGPRFVDPIRFTETVANVPAGQVSIHNGWSAFNATVAAGSASSLAALERGLAFLEEERGQLAVAGGADELNLPMLRAERAQGRMATRAASGPFSAGREGFVGGEGACLIAVERADRAAARGAAPLARVLSLRSGFDPAGWGGPEAGSSRVLEEVLRGAVEEAGLGPREIDLLVAPADGRLAWDGALARAIVSVLGGRGEGPAVVAPKAIIGETWGASGAIGIVVAMEAMRTGTVPGRAADLAIDPRLEALDLPARTVNRTLRTALVLDGSFTGHAAAAVLGAA